MHSSALTVFTGTTPIFLSSSVSPRHGSESQDTARNPTVRLYKYDKSSFTVLDYQDFYLDLKKTLKTQRAEWSLEYQWTLAFGVPDGSGSSVLMAADNILKKSELMQKHVRFHYGSQNLSQKCDDICRRAHTCSFLMLTQDEYLQCISGDETDYTPAIMLVVLVLLVFLFLGAIVLAEKYKQRKKRNDEQMVKMVKNLNDEEKGFLSSDSEDM